MNLSLEVTREQSSLTQQGLQLAVAGIFLQLRSLSSIWKMTISVARFATSPNLDAFLGERSKASLLRKTLVTATCSTDRSTVGPPARPTIRSAVRPRVRVTDARSCVHSLDPPSVINYTRDGVRANGPPNRPFVRAVV